MDRTREALVLRRAPDRSWWNVLVLPAVILLLAMADYNIDGQGRTTQVIAKYVVPVLLAGFAISVLFRSEVVRVDSEALTIDSLLFSWRRTRRIPLREIERLQFDSGSEGSSSQLQIKRSGRMVLVHFAQDISREQAEAFLLSVRFVLPGDD